MKLISIIIVSMIVSLLLGCGPTDNTEFLKKKEQERFQSLVNVCNNSNTQCKPLHDAYFCSELYKSCISLINKNE